jgi:hypothetical protein
VASKITLGDTDETTLDSVIASFSTFSTNASNFLTFQGNTGLVIGSESSAFTLQLTNEMLSFNTKNNGTTVAVASMSDQKLEISEAQIKNVEVEQTLKSPRLQIGKFILESDLNGALNISVSSN